MKKMIKFSFMYFIIAMIAGVFYREFTKYNAFTGRTALAFVHGHFVALGTIVFLILALFVYNFGIDSNKRFKTFLAVYNTGLILTGLMLFVRGITQVKDMALTAGSNAAISGIAGIGHIIIFIGFLILFNILLKIEKN